VFLGLLKMFGFLPFFQPILVYMSKVDGKFKFSPLGVNFLTEAAKVLFAIVMLLFQVHFMFSSGHLNICLHFFLYLV
jgi:hypothetical protein